MPRSSTVAGVTPRVASRRLATAPRARQLLTKPRGRDFVGAENRLAVPACPIPVSPSSGSGTGTPARAATKPDGLRKRNLVVQFDELEDVALAPHPKQLKQPLSPLTWNDGVFSP